MKLLDDPSIEKRTNREAAAEDACSRLNEEQEQCSIAPRTTAWCTPETNRVRPGSIAGTEGLAVNLGGAPNSLMSTPHDRNSQIISDAFHAVVIALAEKTNHRSQSRPTVTRSQREGHRPIVL